MTDLSVVSKEIINYVVHTSVGIGKRIFFLYCNEAYQAVERLLL